MRRTTRTIALALVISLAGMGTHLAERQAAAQTTEEARSQYETEARQKIDRMQSEVSGAQAPETDAYNNVNQALDEAEANWEAMKDASADEWQSFKQSFEESWTRVERQYQEMTAEE